MQTQIELLRTRLLADKKATAKELDQTLALTQKEALLKHAKKDLAASKGHVARLKAKARDLKQQLEQIPQKQQQPAISVSHLGKRKPQNQDIQPSS